MARYVIDRQKERREERRMHDLHHDQTRLDTALPQREERLDTNRFERWKIFGFEVTAKQINKYATAVSTQKVK